MKVVKVKGREGVCDGWYVDQGGGHLDGPHDSRKEAEIVKQAMEWANAQGHD